MMPSRLVTESRLKLEYPVGVALAAAKAPTISARECVSEVQQSLFLISREPCKT